MAIIRKKNTTLQTIFQPASYELVTNLAHAGHSLLAQRLEHGHQERLQRQEVEQRIEHEREETRRLAQRHESLRVAIRELSHLVRQTEDEAVRHALLQDLREYSRLLCQEMFSHNQH
jgi:hypothetical protein